MAGIYLHIPFCRQACHYCNFHFSTSLQGINDFVPALLKEMEWRADYLGGSTVRTIYFGGGTPSLLDPAALDTILDKIHQRFVLAPDPEVTLEANPDDMTDPQKLRAWRSSGINRLSIGIQSFFDDDLRWMNRAHNASQAADSIRLAQDTGFDNLSIDLIYGGPTLPDDRWQRNVAEAIRLQIPHLSCYALTVEPRTALDKLIRQHKRADVSSDDQARQLLLLMDWMDQAGYDHYEISNFALPGHRSRHNSSYWQGKPYLGLGPSAHSFDGRSREWNLANNARYLSALAEDTLPIAEQESLTPVQQLNEYIMISLRTKEGIDLAAVAGRFGPEAARSLQDRARRYVQTGMLIQTERLVLTKEGKLLADGIAADLFSDAGDAPGDNLSPALPKG
ncbi:MAG TPA: radical SAM family heme chaperone HemW [Puia sp.]|jgi:oxygen-independent coproporphyrinogen-3 oxidase|nr:radical SAM family heme chaperone HemW [Puia sp.]